MSFDTVTFTVRPTAARVTSLSQLLSRLLRERTATYRTLLSLLGKMESMATLLPAARVFKRPFQRELTSRVDLSLGYNQLINLEGWLRPATAMWTDQGWISSAVPIRPMNSAVYLFTDASTQGWGGHTDTLTVSGLWSPQESRLHINLLEMEAVARALKHFRLSLTGKHVTVSGDNTSCLAYLRNQGGTKSLTLSLKAEQILLWCLHNKITLSTEFIPGKLNVLADELSRSRQLLPTEWSIAQQALEPLWSAWGKPLIDMFATKFNRKLPLYFSPMHDPEALGRDAFARTWTGLDAYAYPPTSLIPKVLAKVVADRPRMILVTPFWPAAPWFPEVMDLSRGVYLRLSLTEKTLVQPRSGIGHPNVRWMNLTGWLLSGGD